MSTLVTSNLRRPANLLVPADSSLMRSLLSGWVIQSHAIESAEWRAIVRLKEKQLKGKKLRRRFLSAIGLASPLENFRDTSKVKTDYDRIWKGEPWSQPVRMAVKGAQTI